MIVDGYLLLAALIVALMTSTIMYVAVVEPLQVRNRTLEHSFQSYSRGIPCIDCSRKLCHHDLESGHRLCSTCLHNHKIITLKQYRVWHHDRLEADELRRKRKPLPPAA